MRFFLAGVAVWMSVAATASLGASLAASFPEHAMADSGRLLSRVAPVSGKGSPAQQTRQAIEALWKRDRDAQIVKLRVFVNDPSVSSAVSTAIAEAFQKKHAALPVVSLIRVAALPAGASVAVEATSLAKREVNPQGIGFISGQLTSAPKESNADAPVKALAEKSVASLKSVVASIGSAPGRVARVTCFASSLSDYAEVKSLLASEFSTADLNIVRIQKNAENREIECEAVTALDRAPKGPAEIVNPTQAAFAQAALVNTPKFLLTGLATASGDPQVGVKTVFEKLAATLKSAGSGLPSVFYAYAYPVDSNALQKYREVRFTFLDRQKAPASTNLVFEGLGDRDAAIGIELLALPASEVRP